MNVFYQEGEYWTLVFEGQAARVATSRGLLLLSRLLARPGREVHVLDLAGLGNADRSAPAPLLDGIARRAFRDRIVELEADLDEADRFADVGRSERARSELDAVVTELARATGLGGRDRRSASDSERARVAATRAIRAAIARLGQALPNLALHLSHSVRTGTYCVYAPDPTGRVTWELRPPVKVPASTVPPLPARLAVEVQTGRRFVGRVRERRALHEAWRSGWPHRPVVVLVAGEPGIGKTRLVAEFAASSNRDGAAVAYGRCDEEVVPAFGPFTEVLDRVIAMAPSDLLDAHVTQNGPQVGVIATSLFGRVAWAGGRSSASIGADRPRLFRAVASLLADVSQQVPLIVVLDDLHWADGASLALLRHLSRADCRRLLLVGTYRENQVPRSHPLVGFLAALRREPGVSRIHLTGLSPGEVGELAAGVGLDAAANADLQARTGGNPFFVTELLLGIEQGRVGMPAGVRETLVHRLEQLDEPTPRLLRQAAVLGRVFRLDVLAAMADLGIESALEVMDQGVAAGLVVELPDEISRFSFVHALIRDAFYQDLSRSRRAQVHQRAAEVLERLTPEDVRALAHHFSLSPMPGAASQAVRYSRRAAERARGSHAYEEAALLARQAVGLADSHLPGDRAQLADLLVLLGRADIDDGRPEAGKTSLRRAHTLARELDSPQLLAGVALGFGSLSIAMTPREVAEPVAALREAISARQGRDDPDHVRLLCALTRWLSFVAPRQERLDLEERALSMARRLGDEPLIADALVAALYNRSGPPDAEDQRNLADELEVLATRAGDEEKLLIAVLFRAFGLLQQGHYLLAADAEDEFLRASAPLLTPFFVMYRIAIRGRRACLAGDFATAETLAIEMKKAAEDAGWGTDAPIEMQADQLWACWHLQGRFDDMASLTSPGVHGDARLAKVRRAVTALDRPGGALDLDQLEWLDEVLEDDGSPGWWYMAPLLVELCAGLNDGTRARALYDRLVPWSELDLVSEVQAFHGSVQHHLGLLAAAGSRWSAAVDHLTEAVHRHSAAGSPPWVAISTAELGRALIRRDGPGDAERGTLLQATARRSAGSLGVYLRDDPDSVPP